MRILYAGLVQAFLSGATASAGDTIQFCWAQGARDGTIYYAQAVGREDRSASFAELLTISGVEHAGANCFREESALALTRRAELMRQWLGAELEVINTTYMSDLDY